MISSQFQHFYVIMSINYCSSSNDEIFMCVYIIRNENCSNTALCRVGGIHVCSHLSVYVYNYIYNVTNVWAYGSPNIVENTIISRVFFVCTDLGCVRTLEHALHRFPLPLFLEYYMCYLILLLTFFLKKYYLIFFPKALYFNLKIRVN